MNTINGKMKAAFHCCFVERQMKVGLNTFDDKLWIADLADEDGEQYEIPLIGWN